MNVLDWRDVMVKAVLEANLEQQEPMEATLRRALEPVAQEVVREIGRVEAGCTNTEAQARQLRIDATARALYAVAFANAQALPDKAYSLARDLEHARERHLERERLDHEAEAQRRSDP